LDAFGRSFFLCLVSQTEVFEPQVTVKEGDMMNHFNKWLKEKGISKKEFLRNSSEIYELYQKEREEQRKEIYFRNYELQGEKQRKRQRQRYREDLEHRERVKEYARNYYAENPDLYKSNRQVRRAIEKALPTDPNFGNLWLDVVERFGGCALTGKTEEIELDHFICIATGHGGTIMENCIPLHKDLNRNKRDKNPFDWFEESKEEFNLDEDRWFELISYLAIRNDMTVEEYEQFIRWCYENPRTIVECEKDKRRSADIWREVTRGKSE
jgi:hypothetical protein